jgi:hypothetical protein
VDLPAQAKCSGDTASGGYRVYSYLVPKGTKLSSVTFVNFPSTGYGFVDNTGTYYGPVNTAITTGQIIGIPANFEWGPLVTTDGGSLALATLLYSGDTSGIWEAGLACANTKGALSDSWNTEITFSASAGDANGFTWTAVPGVTAAATITSVSSAKFAKGTAGSFTVTATGSPAPTISESGALPSGVTFSGGVLKGAASASGTFPITFTAHNGAGADATQKFTLTVSDQTTAATSTTTTAPSSTTTTGPTSSSTTTTTAAGTVAASSTGGGSSPSSGTGADSTGTATSAGTLAYTGLHTFKALGLGLLGIGIGLMLLGWGYRKKIRPARTSTR